MGRSGAVVGTERPRICGIIYYSTEDLDGSSMVYCMKD